MIKLSAPNLTQHPPRSPRVQLGGYVHLPRLLDKARATLAGKAGEYNYDCPLDQHFFRFTRISAKALLAEVRRGRSDSQMLAWVRRKSRRLPHEVAAWSAWLSARAPGAADGHAHFSESIRKRGPRRDDIHGFFDLLDLDDYASFGGKP
jgi:hypothetical protein